MLVYLTSIPGDFVFDDKLIQRDARILGETSFWTIFVTDYWYGYIGTAADLYRPLTIATYAINHALSGLWSPAFHLVNVVLHALVSVLVALLVEATLRDHRLAVVSGLLFATHPVHTEAVANIVGRAELLSALFLLSALYLHARGYRVGRLGAGPGMTLAGICTFAALLSKESAIVAPGLLLLVDAAARLRDRGRIDRGETASEETASRPTLPALLVCVGAVVVYLLIRHAVLGRWIQEPPPRPEYLLFGHPWDTRLFTALVIFGTYLRLLFLPSQLSADYSFRQLPLTDSLDSLAGLVGLGAALLIPLALLWAVHRRVVWLAFALGFFAIGYGLVSNLVVPIGVLVAERLMYLPSVGFVVAIAGTGLSFARWVAREGSAPWLRDVPVLLLGAVLILYGGRTVVRNLDWADHETLYRATVEASPRSHSARFNYAAILLTKGRDREALEQLRAAQEIRDDHYPSWVNLTVVHLRLGRPREALAAAERGLEVKPDSSKLRQLARTARSRLPGGP